MRMFVIAAAYGLISFGVPHMAAAETAHHGAEKPAASHAAPAQDHAPQKASTKAHDGGHEIHWEYSGAGGPSNWGKIKSDYKACRLGKFQSPVDLKATIGADLPALNVDYKQAPLTVLNNGHTVQVNYPPGSTMNVDGTVFDMLQFHFHTPSEHTINGKAYEMELHFVHKTKDGRLGVLGVMIAQGRHNPAAQAIWDHLPMGKADAKLHKNVTIDAHALLPQKLSYFRLMGSLTTPPCSEGVNWHVLANPIEFSAAQIQKFKQAFAMNARPVQPDNARLIVIDD